MKRSARGMSIILVDSLQEFTHSIVAASLCCAMLLLATPVRAELRIQPPDQSIQPADSGKVSGWGGAVAVDGNTAMIGGFVADVEGGGNQSSIVEVYVRHRSGKWVYDSTILPPPEGGLFGESIALRGDLALITGTATTGIFSYHTVHVFRRTESEWRYVQTVSPPVLSFFDSFGRSMAIDGHTAVIGSFITNSAHVYRITREGTLEFQQTLTVDVPFAGAVFGRSVAVEGNTILVGAAGDVQQGAVYVFERFGGEWQQMQKLVSSNPALTMDFGFTLALDGRVAVITSAVEDFVSDGPSAVHAGAAYVFIRSGGVWIEQQRLTGDLNHGFFGSNVAIDDGHILVGERVGIGQEATSRVLHFERIRGAWVPVAQFTQGPGITQFGVAVLGQSIGVSHATAFIGAAGLHSGVGDVLVYDLHQRSHRQW
jgi:hypothetical protein